MKKLLSVLILSLLTLSVFAQEEDYLQSVDTGVLVTAVGQVVPIGKIEIINPTCVVGITKVAAAGNRPFISYAFWSGQYGMMKNAFGMKFSETKAITVLISMDEEFEFLANIVKNWFYDNAPKDVKEIETEVGKLLKKHNPNHNSYIFFKFKDEDEANSRFINYMATSKNCCLA